MKRSVRGELTLLGCLAVLVAVLSGVVVAGPGMLERSSGDALAARLEQEQRDAPGITHRMRFDPEVERPGETSVLGADLGRFSTLIENAAPAALRGDLVRDSTRIALPGVRTGEGTTLSLLYASDAPPAAAYAAGRPPRARGGVVEIAVSTRTRDALKLRLGQELRLGPGALENVDAPARVVGFFAADDGRRLWREQPLLARTARDPRGGADDAVRYAGALLAPRGVEVLQNQSRAELTVVWGMRLDPGADAARFVGDQGQRDFERLMFRYPESVQGVTCDFGTYGGMACALGSHPATEVETATQLPDTLDEFQRQWRQGSVVISFALASVTAVGLAAVVVASLLSVRRRLDVHRLQRARGASASGIALGRALWTAPAVVLGFVAGCAGASLLPGAASASSAASTASASAAYGRGVLVALCAWLLLPLLTWWAVRDRALLRDRGSGGGRRAVAEAGVLVVAAGGVLALRARGTTGGSGDDPLLAAVPVLLGLATVVVLVRLYPLPVRLVARWSARWRGAVVLIALSRAAKEAPARALALLVLVVTLAGAVFGGLVTGTLTEGRRDAAAWRVGADASFLGAGRDPETAERLARARGVRETVTVRQLRVDPMSGTDGGRYGIASLVGVDGLKLRSAAGSSPAARALIGAGISGGGGSRDIRVLADAADAGDVLTVTVHGKERRLRVVGPLPDAVRSDPALGPVRDGTEGSERLLLADNRDLEAFEASEFEESALLLYGPRLDPDRLRSVVPRTAPGIGAGELRIRAEEQAEADEDGLIAAVTAAHTACTAVAVLLALLALVLELLLSAPARGSTAARLRTLGLGGRGVAGLHLLQLIPLVLAAVAGGVTLGLTLPELLGPALDLREFTGGPTAPALRTDALFTAVPAAGAIALVAAAVGVETWLGRRRGLGAVLRLGRNDD
ncbi:hypothetical protein OG453_28380 [Streptomyces sp. NBC_01381]|uniref:hypothetical protein n=1 Tax=Streptomyces sp. NBC_01381 TaxID=2903845 RepID=UPI00224DAFA3|nr:hypothetical protein [Streptomyces sp. NBC_01381]MCX4670565.1 hypothetical protein [Streptomyces sp. NBC_01381]